MIGLLAEIVVWTGIQEIEANMARVEGAIFKEDFDPWKKGDTVPILQLVHKEGETATYLESVGVEGKVLQSCRVVLVSAE